MRTTLVVFVLFICSLTTSCGSVWVIPAEDLESTQGGKGAKGVRFYAPAPYVWITPATPSDKVNVATEQKTDHKPSGDKPTQTTTESLVFSVAKPSYSAQIVFLPDYEEQYVIQWKSGIFGSVQPKFTIENGWNLTQFESTINTGLSAAISLQGTSASTSTKTATAFNGFAADPDFRGPGLYRLKYDDSKQSWTLGPKVFLLN